MTTIETHASSAAPAGAGLSSVAEWITTTDHKRLGRLYLGASALSLMGSLVVAALLAFERVDTATTFLNIGSITQLFSVYRFGLTYMVMLPVVIGVALVVVPLQLGSRSLAFPRLAAAGFWTWLIGAIASVVAIVGNGGPNGGNPRFVDLFTLAAALALAGLVLTLVSLATSILTTRTPGMNMKRVPVFSWSVLVMALTSALALPIVIGLLVLVYVAHKYPSLSELSGNHAVDSWVSFGFTHPTTILFTIPVFGFLAEVVATSSKRRLRPRGPVLAAIALIGVALLATAIQTPVIIRAGFRSLSGGDKISDLAPYVVVHVLPLLGAFLAVALVLPLVGRAKPSAPLVLGVLAALLGLAGIAASALQYIGDAALIGTTFEEGTWLLLVSSVVVFAMGAVVYWAPKWSGRCLPGVPAMGLGFLTFVGGLLAGVPMLIAGFADQPGAVFPAVEPGVDGVIKFSYSGPSGLWNVLTGVGLSLMLVTTLAFVALTLRAAAKGERAGDDPWDGQTLEWATTSPAPSHNFAALHVITSAEPLLDLKPATTSERSDA
jgi:heme/copper-type cytochrome/quinol oxidase subunit 1